MRCIGVSIEWVWLPLILAQRTCRGVAEEKPVLRSIPVSQASKAAMLGVPMGGRLTGQRPGIREIQVRYGGGNFYNGGPGQFSGTPARRD